MPLGLLFFGVGLLALLAWSDSDRHPSLEADEDIPGVNAPASPPGEVVHAFLEEIEAQSRPGKGSEVRQILDRFLSIGTPTWAAVAVPCDQRFQVPNIQYWKRISTALAYAYGVYVDIVPMQWAHPKYGEVDLCVVVFFTRNTHPPSAHILLTGLHRQAGSDAGQFQSSFGSFGGIDVLGLALQTAIQAAIGTVVSMKTSDLYRSMGGERRLARLMRRYKQTGNPRIKDKILRTASRLKGRQVDWNEVAALAAQEGYEL